MTPSQELALRLIRDNGLWVSLDPDPTDPGQWRYVIGGPAAPVGVKGILNADLPTPPDALRVALSEAAAYLGAVDTGEFAEMLGLHPLEPVERRYEEAGGRADALAYLIGPKELREAVSVAGGSHDMTRLRDRMSELAAVDELTRIATRQSGPGFGDEASEQFQRAAQALGGLKA